MKPRIMHPPAGGETWFEEGCFITELCNSPGDPALSIARARVAPGTETEWHSRDRTRTAFHTVQEQIQTTMAALGWWE